MYTYERRVTYSEVSMNGYADISQILDYFQDCSSFQSEKLGVGLAYQEQTEHAWMLASWQVVVERYPEYGDRIITGTWAYGFDAVYGYRNFILKDDRGNRLAAANSLWLLVDMTTGHPMRITEEYIAAYQLEPKAEMAYLPRKIGFREALSQTACLPVTMGRTLIDTNHHVNNAQYIRMALELIPETFAIYQLRTEYKKAAVVGDTLYPYMKQNEHQITIVFCDADKKPYVIVELEQRPEKQA